MIKKTNKTTKANLECKELNTGLRMNEHTLDAIVSPGYYVIECNNINGGENFPNEIHSKQVSAYLEVNTTVSRNDRLKTNAIGQILTVTDSSGATNIFHRSCTCCDGVYTWSAWSSIGGKMSGDIVDGSVTMQKLSTDVIECINNKGNYSNTLAVKRFYMLPKPEIVDNQYVKITNETLFVLGQEETFYKYIIKNGGSFTHQFKASEYNITVNVPVHIISYIYTEKEQKCHYQLYSATNGYLVQKQNVTLKPGWNTLELEYTFKSVDSSTLSLFIGKISSNEFYFYKALIYNGIIKPNEINEHTTDTLHNRITYLEGVSELLKPNLLNNVLYEDEDIVYYGKGTVHDTIIHSLDVMPGDELLLKLDAISKPVASKDTPYFRLQFKDENNANVINDFFCYSAVDTLITIPENCVKINYLFGLSVENISVLDGEYRWHGLTFIHKSRVDIRMDGLEKRIIAIENIAGNWNGKILSTYGDSITALQSGNFEIPYNETSNRWGNRVANYLKMSKHYGRGIGGQKYAWGSNGGSITWIYKDTGIMYNRNDAFNLDNWDGVSFPSTWTDIQKNTLLNGLADGSIVSVRGCSCSWLRITSMYPDSIRHTIDAVFVMFHNDAVDGTEFAWIEGDTTDPEWAASSYYATYGGDYNINTLEGGIASTIMKLQAWLPNAVIILGTPINGQGIEGKLRPDADGLYKQVEHIKNVGLRFSIPVIDVYATCGINGLNRTNYITDSIHPYSVAGSKMVAKAVIGGFTTILPNGIV